MESLDSRDSIFTVLVLSSHSDSSAKVDGVSKKRIDREFEFYDFFHFQNVTNLTNFFFG